MSLKNLTGKHLTLEDREYIQAALERGIPLSDMADRLRKDPTTISKEIKRSRVIGSSEFNGFGGRCQKPAADSAGIPMFAMAVRIGQLAGYERSTTVLASQTKNTKIRFRLHEKE